MSGTTQESLYYAEFTAAEREKVSGAFARAGLGNAVQLGFFEERGGVAYLRCPGTLAADEVIGQLDGVLQNVHCSGEQPGTRAMLAYYERQLG